MKTKLALLVAVLAIATGSLLVQAAGGGNKDGVSGTSLADPEFLMFPFDGGGFRICPHIVNDF